MYCIKKFQNVKDMKNLLDYKSFDKINEGYDFLNKLRYVSSVLYNKVRKFIKIFGTDVLSKSRKIVEQNLVNYSNEDIRFFCKKFGISFILVEQLYGIKEEFSFKKILMIPILALLLLASCSTDTEDMFEKDEEGNYLNKEIYLEKGKKLMDIDIVRDEDTYDYNIWTLTRDMVDGDTAEKYEYKTTVKNETFTIIIIESAENW